MLYPIGKEGEDNTFTVELTSEESKMITIGGINYTFTNKSASENTITYTYDSATNLLTIDGGEFALDASGTSSKNIVVNGEGTVDINLGNGSNTLTVNSADEANINANNGNNTIIAECLANITVGSGNNTITTSVDNSFVKVGRGLNTLNINANAILETADDANLSISLMSGKTLEASINSKSYSLENAQNFSINSSSSSIIFNGNNLEITTLMAQANNIVLQGSAINYTTTT